MPDLLTTALAQPGLGWLALIIFVAGCVRGFAGFGTGLIFIPLGAIFMPPIWVLLALTAVDMVGTFPLIPRALRDGAVREVGLMVLGCAICLPIGVLSLSLVDPTVFRWLVSALVLGMVVLMASGWRHSFTLGTKSLVGIGGLSGLLGGFVGMPGPPPILAFMSGQYPPERIRGNIMSFILVFEFMFFATLVWQGLFQAQPFVIGIVLIIPYVIGNLIGARIFDPAKARVYRSIAFAIVAASGILGLPLVG